MTYIELLSEIDKRIELTHELGGCHPEQHALRAVVELHKPQDITLPNGEWGLNCQCCDGWDYPCPTTQVIEKELG